MLSLWFPFIKDITQQGLSSASITAVGSGASLNDNGKLGKCYYFDGTGNGYMITDFPTNIGTADFSISVWVKIPTITSGTYFAICTSKTTAATGVGFGIYWNYSQKKFLWSTADGSASTEIWMATAVDDIVYDKWIHLVMVRNSSDPKIGYFYINGVRYELASVPVIRNIATSTNLNIGRTTNGSYPCKMYMNDLRIYVGEALSLKEIKLLSQGLVAHYKLTGWLDGINPNMLKLIPKAHNPSIYLAYQFDLTENLVAGETYTIQLWDVDVSHSEKSESSLGVWVYWGGGSVNLLHWTGTTYFTNGHADHLTVTFTVTSSQASGSGASNAWLNIYNSVGYVAGTMNMSIGRWKLEKGDTATPYCHTVEEMGGEDTTVYDTSGYNYNGINYDSIINSSAPKYLASTEFNGSTAYIEFTNLAFMPNILPNEWSFAFWVYNQDVGSRSVIFSNYNLGGVGGSSFGFEKTTGELLRVVYVNGTFDKTIPDSTMTSNTWVHFCITKTSEHLISVYRNGELIYTYTNANCASSGVIYRLGRDSRSDNTMFKGKLSDFRVYATAISAEDILELYHTSASIDKNGNLYAYELKEG